MASNKKFETSTFWQLLTRNEIVIPCYQRDYAQGREDKNAADIRANFIKDIQNAIANKEELNINLVFGSENNKQFIPVDGQQRLTMLFFVHWYIALKANMLSDRNIKVIFKKFKYKTRSTTVDFFNVLTEIVPDELEEEGKLSLQIQNQKDFFRKFTYDPTVKSALCVLDEIKKVFAENTLWKEYWDYLTDDECPLNMNLIRIEEYHMEDSLYLKMNGRGKPLSDYENFKAWIIGYIQKNGWKIKIGNNAAAADWETKLDVDWLDIFWKYKDDSDFIVDQEYMRYFNGMIQLAIAEGAETNKEKAKKDIQKLSSKGQEELQIPLGEYEKLVCFEEQGEKSINVWFNVLEKLKDDSVEFLTQLLTNSADSKNDVVEFFIKGRKGEQVNIFRKFISEQTTYQDKLRFYGLYRFLLAADLNRREDPSFKKSFKQWMRVVRNIVEDTNNDVESLMRMVDYFKRLSGEVYDVGVYDVLSEWGIKEEKTLPEVIKMEAKKASFILKYPKFETDILHIENHPLFRGKIDFLMNMFPIDEVADLSKFQKYAHICYELFDANGSIDKNYTLLRALFAAGWEPQSDVCLYNNGEIWRNGILMRPDITAPLKILFNKLIDIAPEQYIDTLEKYANESYADKSHVDNVYDNLIQYKDLLAKIETPQAKLYDKCYLFFKQRTGTRLDKKPLDLFNKIKTKLSSEGFDFEDEPEFLDVEGAKENFIKNKSLCLFKDCGDFEACVWTDDMHVMDFSIKIGFRRKKEHNQKPTILTDKVLAPLKANPKDIEDRATEIVKKVHELLLDPLNAINA